MDTRELIRDGTLPAHVGGRLPGSLGFVSVVRAAESCNCRWEVKRVVISLLDGADLLTLTCAFLQAFDTNSHKEDLQAASTVQRQCAIDAATTALRVDNAPSVTLALCIRGQHERVTESYH
ncbi:hypothetical protein J6590_004116 [Homalodisca vitripennis]|nr:hypothetical protein J6590_004116 [Homalodisca vitripennis]